MVSIGVAGGVVLAVDVDGANLQAGSVNSCGFLGTLGGLGGLCLGGLGQRLARGNLQRENGHVVVGGVGNVLNGITANLTVRIHPDLVLGNDAMVNGQARLEVGRVFAPLVERAVQIGFVGSETRIGKVTRGQNTVGFVRLIGVPVTQHDDGTVARDLVRAVIDQLRGKCAHLLALGVEMCAEQQEFHAACFVAKQGVIDAARHVARNAAAPLVGILFVGGRGAPEMILFQDLKALGLPQNQRGQIPFLLVLRAVKILARAGKAVGGISVLLAEGPNRLLPCKVDLAEYDQIGIFCRHKPKCLVTAVCNKGNVLVIVRDSRGADVVFHRLDADGLRIGYKLGIVRDLIVVNETGAGDSRAHARAVRAEYHCAVGAVIKGSVVGKGIDISAAVKLHGRGRRGLVKLEILVGNDKEAIFVQKIGDAVQRAKGLVDRTCLLGGVVKPQRCPVLGVVHHDGNLAGCELGCISRAEKRAGVGSGAVRAVAERKIGKRYGSICGIVDLGVGKNVCAFLNRGISFLPFGVEADLGNGQALTIGRRRFGKGAQRGKQHQAAQ